MITIGVDVGSMTTKAVLLNGEQWTYVIKATGCSPRETAKEAYLELLEQSGTDAGAVTQVLGTGYGRIALDFTHRSLTEITCHAKGAEFLLPGADMVIDIGGQDSKAIKTDGQGNVVDFAMNDKCAAGTGRFLQVIASALGTDVSELAGLSVDAEPVEISNMCTVFAESEVVSLLAQGTAKENIIAGLHRSVAKRVAVMTVRLGTAEKVVFTGGVAKNTGVQKSLAQELGVQVHVDTASQLAGALGAALLARG